MLPAVTVDDALTTQPGSRHRQPPGVLTLALVEMWERFSFYGMVALLVLFLIAPEDGPFPPGPGQGFSEIDAAALFGCYSALVLAAPLVGGWIGDRLIGPRRALVIGAALIASGHFAILIPGLASFWVGLLVIAAGTGLLKPNISTVLGSLYSPGDTRRDGGFSLFYLGINIGAFTAPIICGALATMFSWRLAFSVAGFGMLLGLAQYLLGRGRLGDAGRAVPRPADAGERRRALIGAVIALLVIATIFTAVIAIAGFSAGTVSGVVTVVVLLAAIGAFWLLLRRRRSTEVEARHLRAFAILFVASVVYFALSSQAGSTITEFAQDWTDRSFGSWTMPTSWLMSLNPVLVVCLSPLAALLWTRLGTRAPRTPVKISVGLIGVGAAFLIMVIPALAADRGASSGLIWILATFLAITLAELLIVPIALATTTELAPAGLTGQLLGIWYLAASLGGAIGGQLARLVQGLGGGGYFLTCGLVVIALGLMLMSLRSRWTRLLAPVR